MRKSFITFSLLLITSAIAMAEGMTLLRSVGAQASIARNETIKITDAPFLMPEFHVPVFPDRRFDITRYGAVRSTSSGTGAPKTHKDSVRVANKNAMAISKAMRACNRAGGGHVVIPDGRWLVGAVHFMSNCDLHLSDNAELTFTDIKECYLPMVETTWEGMECMNYSPLVYAYRCRNVGISGKGTLKAITKGWSRWFKVTPEQLKNTEFKLYDWASTDVPVNERLMVGEQYDMVLRPQLIQFNQCEGVVLQDFKIRNSPFWTTHLYRCENVVMRGVDSYAHGRNNDGVDIEMTQNMLVEDCIFDQGDDGIVLKAGRNQDAWRINRPTKNIVIRNCYLKDAHGMLVVGSEISGGIRNVWMHDCHSDGKMLNFCYIKTNPRRGAIIDGIWMNDCEGGTVTDRLFAIDTDILYQWKNAKTYKETVTTIRNIHVKNIRCKSVQKGMIGLFGDARCPVENVTAENLSCETNNGYTTRIKNISSYEEKNIPSTSSGQAPATGLRTSPATAAK